jgi:RimJ/RimL family protein N-acetyltransferase
VIETARLRLRSWEARDRAPFARLNADPEVMRYFPKPLSRAESDGLIGRLEARWASDGFNFAVAERRADGTFVGMVGLARVQFPLPGTPDGAIEVGWRLAREHWGRATPPRRRAPGWTGGSPRSRPTRSSPSPSRPTAARRR